jgi:methionyl aminopeptidase
MAQRKLELSTAKKSLVKREPELARLRLAGKLVSELLEQLRTVIKVGMRTDEIDLWCKKELFLAGANPAPPLYGFPATVCTSVNDVAVHGVPGRRILKDGDVITVDISLELGGWFADGAATYQLGVVSDPVKLLYRRAQRVLEKTVALLQAGMDSNRIGLIVSALAKEHGVFVLPDCSGHGIGRELHEVPIIPYTRQERAGILLPPGSVFTLEPVFTLKESRLIKTDDTCNLRTADSLPTMQWEFMLAMAADGVEVLTKHSFLRQW